jgi:hypothetical protein
MYIHPHLNERMTQYLFSTSEKQSGRIIIGISSSIAVSTYTHLRLELVRQIDTHTKEKPNQTSRYVISSWHATMPFELVEPAAVPRVFLSMQNLSSIFRNDYGR